ncbi:MAG: histidinol-phosphate transaminase [Alphaproteobacteria bacterium]|nr:histidinol-phosphate transaminase [Alphaproteobacteria bacterium]
MSLPQAKAHILDITPYAQGKSKGESTKQRIIKLSSNENPLGPSQKAIAAFRTMSDLHRYPDGAAHAIREAIAEVFSLDINRLVMGAGSDELINFLIHAYAGKGDEVLYSEHSFLMYKIYTIAHGATPVTAPETNLTTNVDALLDAVTENTKIVFVANPNNPTGTLVAQSEIDRLRAELPEHVLLVLDAAYAEYVEDADYDAGAKLVESTNNTVMLRTFSKIYGLPALRIGWAYAPEAVVSVLNRVRSPFNVNSAAMVAAIAAVKDTAYTRYAVEYNAKERQRLNEALTAMELEVTPSAGNFILVHFPATGKTAQAANTHLLNANIIAREVGAYKLPNSLRFTIGTQEENTLLIEAMQEFMA